MASSMVPIMNFFPRTALTMLVALVSAVALRSHSGVNGPRVRSFHLEYKAELADFSDGAKRADLWVPVPHDDPWQQITKLDIQSANAYERAKAANGNEMLHIGVSNPAARVAVLISVEATRSEHIQPGLHNDQAPIQNESVETLAAYLKPD